MIFLISYFKQVYLILISGDTLRMFYLVLNIMLLFLLFLSSNLLEYVETIADYLVLSVVFY